MELASQREAAEMRARAKAERRAERLAAKAAARQAKEAAKAAKAAARASAGLSQDERSVQFAGGRLVVSFNTVVMLVTASAVCLLMLAGYSLGRWSMGGKPGTMATAAAITKPSEPSPTPLLPSLSRQQDKEKPSRREEAPQSPDLSHLLKPPPARQPEAGVVANGSPKPNDEPTDASAAAKLNYLQIESFLITRDRSGDVVAKDLEDARRFLADRGVKTVARRHSNGYVLYSEQGFPPDKDSAKQREAFRRKVEALGQEYRKAGGAYEFKGCGFVGYNKTKQGQPV